MVNASRVVRYLAAQGVVDPWGEYDRARIAQVLAWDVEARAWEREQDEDASGYSRADLLFGGNWS